MSWSISATSRMPCITIKFNPAIGPIITLGIGQPKAISSASDDNPPKFHVCQALIDTGADLTCISPEVAQAVGLDPAGKRPMASSTEVRA